MLARISTVDTFIYMKVVILSLLLTSCQVAAVQVLVALLYCTVPCCTVLYCILVFVLTFCMHVASVKCMQTVTLHYLFNPYMCP